MSKSVVWKYFSVKACDNSFAVCNSCKSSIKRGGKDKRSFTTTNLQNHLRRKHSIIIVKNRVVSQPRDNPTLSVQDESEDDPQEQVQSSTDLVSSPSTSSIDSPSTSTGQLPRVEKKSFSSIGSSLTKQPTLIAVFNKTKKFASDDPRSKEITKKIAEMICTDDQPFSVVDDVGFRRLISHLEPRYPMVTRQHLSNTIIPEMYDKLTQQVVNVVAGCENVAITSDIWTSTAGHDYFSVTIHFLNASWELTQLALEVKRFEGATHTAELIAENWHATFEKWGLSNKVIAMLTDGAANMKAAVSLTSIQGFTCNIHLLQLVLKNSCFVKSSVCNLLSTAKKIVTHFHHSVNSSKVLRQAQATLGVPLHELIQDEPTRWNSTFHMLQRLVEQRTAITVATSSINLNVQLMNSDWILAENLVKILKLFDEATNSLSSSKATLGDVIPIVKSLECATQNFTTVQGLSAIAKDIEASLKKKFCDVKTNKFYMLATALDPRYKTR